MKRIILGGCLLTFVASCFAQAPARPITGPTTRMAWSMRIQPDAKPAKEPAATPDAMLPQEPNRLDVTRSDGRIRVEVFTENAPTREYWQVPEGVLGRIGKSGEIQVFSLDFPRYPYASSGFYGIESVKAEDEQELAMFEGAKCRYFRGVRKLTVYESREGAFMGEPAKEGTVEYEAWFDFETGLPKGYRAGGKTFQFQFRASPSGEITLPAEYAAALEKARLELRRAGLAR